MFIVPCGLSESWHNTGTTRLTTEERRMAIPLRVMFHFPPAGDTESPPKLRSYYEGLWRCVRSGYEVTHSDVMAGMWLVEIMTTPQGYRCTGLLPEYLEVFRLVQQGFV